MVYDYTCPECKGHLLVNGYVILSVRKRNGKRGLVMLDPELGNYGMIKHASLDFKKGEILEIHCPICHYDLICIPEKNLAKVMAEEKTGELLTVLFSVVFGEKVTVKVKGEEAEIIGEELHVDFENLSLCK